MPKFPPYHIAVFGSAAENLPHTVTEIAESVGREIAQKGHVLISPVSMGVGFFAAKGAKSAGGVTIGISPTASPIEQSRYDVPFEYLDHVIHTGFGFKGRNVVSVRTCDGLIVVNGRFGTLSEVAIAVGERKPIVALPHTGGCASILMDVFTKLEVSNELLATADTPEMAVTQIVSMIQSHQ